MKKLSVAILFLVVATGAGCKEQPKPSVVECRFRFFDPDTKTTHIGKWKDCKVIEDTEEYIYETVDQPGLIIWTEEHTQQGKKWSDPITHTKPRILPDVDFEMDLRKNS